jgi:hypothetical protein
MAEYIKLGTAAKVVVAMVFGALLTGVVENAQGGSVKVTVRPAAGHTSSRRRRRRRRRGPPP